MKRALAFLLLATTVVAACGGTAAAPTPSASASATASPTATAKPIQVGLVTDVGNNENLPNVANLFFKEQEAGYLVGVIAATMAKNKVGKATHNTVCSMGGIPIPPVDHYIAGYQDAIKTISPTTTILNGYSN